MKGDGERGGGGAILWPPPPCTIVEPSKARGGAGYLAVYVGLRKVSAVEAAADLKESSFRLMSKCLAASELGWHQSFGHWSFELARFIADGGVAGRHRPCRRLLPGSRPSSPRGSCAENRASHLPAYTDQTEQAGAAGGRPGPCRRCFSWIAPSAWKSWACPFLLNYTCITEGGTDRMCTYILCTLMDRTKVQCWVVHLTSTNQSPCTEDLFLGT